jgi:hypothetical protein
MKRPLPPPIHQRLITLVIFSDCIAK